MATLSRLIFYPLLIAFFFGKLIPIVDVFIVAFAVTNLFSHHQRIKNKYMLLFTITAIISNLLYFNFWGWLYLVRLLSLVSLLIYPPELDSIQHKFLNTTLASSIIFGIVQYFIWPNLTAMSSQNWDPHLYRLVGSYFDPTFTGLIFLFILLYIYFSKTKIRNILLVVVYLALALTYSRSTLLSFISTFSYISYIKKSWKVFFICWLVFLSTMLVLPRLEGEGTKLERTSSIFAKIENYKQGIKILAKNPIVGIGYNNIPLLNYKNNPQSHSSSGFDSSLLTIAITTGVFGLWFLLLGLGYEFIHGNLFYQSLLISIFIHSLFANSLFYPYTFLLLCLLKINHPVAKPRDELSSFPKIQK